MGDYEQMEMDIRLDSERNLKDNLVKVIQFTYNNQERERKLTGDDLGTVRNKHEGYGIAAEAHSRIQNCEKDLKNGMGDYLAKLQVEGDEAIKECSRLYKGRRKEGAGRNASDFSGRRSALHSTILCKTF